ncbi:MAG: hypothetical protein ACOCT9_03235 [archaeon]
MDVFKWISYIEELCNDLMENSKEEILSEIQSLRKEQENRNKELAKERNKIVNLALIKLTRDLNEKVDEFEDKFQEELDKIRDQYYSQKQQLQNKVLEKIGLEF